MEPRAREAFLRHADRELTRLQSLWGDGRETITEYALRETERVAHRLADAATNLGVARVHEVAAQLASIAVSHLPPRYDFGLAVLELGEAFLRIRRELYRELTGVAMVPESPADEQEMRRKLMGC